MITYTNEGTHDVAAPRVEVSASDGAMLSLPDGSEPQPGYFQIQTQAADGDPDVIRPGQVATAELLVTPTITTDSVDVSVGQLDSANFTASDAVPAAPAVSSPAVTMQSSAFESPEQQTQFNPVLTAEETALYAVAAGFGLVAPRRGRLTSWRSLDSPVQTRPAAAPIPYRNNSNVAAKVRADTQCAVPFAKVNVDEQENVRQRLEADIRAG